MVGLSYADEREARGMFEKIDKNKPRPGMKVNIVRKGGGRRTGGGGGGGAVARSTSVSMPAKKKKKRRIFSFFGGSDVGLVGQII